MGYFVTLANTEPNEELRKQDGSRSENETDFGTSRIRHQEGTKKNLTAHSKKEQNRAGLDSLSSSEYNLLSRLNKEYMIKFKFPFIIAVSGLYKEGVFKNIKARLKNSVEIEFNTAIEEIHKIAEIRLKDLD